MSGYDVKDFTFRMRNDVMVRGDRDKVADLIEKYSAELDKLRAENESLRGALEEIASYDTGATAGLAYTAKEALK